MGDDLEGKHYNPLKITQEDLEGKQYNPLKISQKDLKENTIIL
jgi:hypothetical protein